MCKKGFTLIEVLVVVVIIAVLAAIALPQYMRAVEQTRTAEVLSVIRSVANAEEYYFLKNGKYTSETKRFTIDLPVTSKYEVTIDNTDGNYNILGLHKEKGKTVQHFRFFMANINGAKHEGEFLCLAPVDNEDAKTICENLGAQPIGDYEYESGIEARRFAMLKQGGT